MHEGDVLALIPINWLLPPATHRRCWFGKKKAAGPSRNRGWPPPRENRRRLA
jgi:hypothetical protein